MLTIVLIISIFSLGIFSLYKCIWDLDFWKKRNVKGPKPNLIFGNYKDVIGGKIHLSELAKQFYEEFKEEKMVGVFALNSPVLILRDLDLIKDVLVNDFSVFSGRGIHVFDTVEPLSQHLFNLPYSTWKHLRSHLTAAFTGNKEMFATVQDVADRFMRFVERQALKENYLDCLTLFGKYTTEIIGEYCFALKMHQLEDEYTEFQKVCKNRQSPNKYNFIRRFVRQYVPTIYPYISIFLRDKSMTDYFVNMLRKINSYRKMLNVSRKDFVNRLLELKDKPDTSDKLLAAQAYVLFSAGADTLSVIISNGLYEFAMNEVIQQKLHDEISNILKSKTSISRDDLKNMPYLNKVYEEILRKYPLRDIVRQSNDSYTFRGTNVTIPKNTKIIIPHFAIQRNSEYYPNPELFNPERFIQQEHRHPMAYMPFGNGPRYCIGKKWAEIIVKITIIKLIINFKIKISEKNQERKKNIPRNVFLWPKGGVNLKFEKRRL